jgi:GcrA cell cycle regulator
MAGTTRRFGELIQVQRDLRVRVDHGLVAPIARRIDSAIERGSHGLIHPNVTRAAGGRPRDRCDHSIKVRKPFHRRLPKLVHSDCRLSQRRFDFHSVRVSGEKTALVQIASPGPLTERAHLVGAPRCFWRGSRMMPWTTQEISLLISFWPTASAAQISRRLNRSRASICGKAMRLRRGKLLPVGVQKHFEVKPVRMRPSCATTTVTSIIPAKPMPPVDATVPQPEMRRCSLLELDNGQCRWPLGDVRQAAALFCGDAAMPGLPYCQHHLWMARYDSGPQSDRGPHRVNRGFSRGCRGSAAGWTKLATRF